MPRSKKGKRLSTARIGHDFPDIDLSPIRKPSDAVPTLLENLDETSFMETIASQRSMNVSDMSTRSHLSATRSTRYSGYAGGAEDAIAEEEEDAEAEYLSGDGEAEESGEDIERTNRSDMITNCFDDFTRNARGESEDESSSPMELHVSSCEVPANYRSRRRSSMGLGVTLPLPQDYNVTPLSFQDGQRIQGGGMSDSRDSDGFGSPSGMIENRRERTEILESIERNRVERIPQREREDSRWGDTTNNGEGRYGHSRRETMESEEGRNRGERSTSLWDEEKVQHRTTYVDSSDKAYAELTANIDSMFEHRSLAATDDLLEVSASNPRNMILRGTTAHVPKGCCPESGLRYRSMIREMGGRVNHNLTSSVTHVIFTSSGDKEVLKKVLEMPRGPYLVAPQWLEDCYSSMYRKPEEPYSMHDLRYLINRLNVRGCTVSPSGSVRKSRGPSVSDVDMIELSPENDVLDGTGMGTGHHRGQRRSSLEEDSELRGLHFDESGELTFDHPLSASELLTKIDVLTRKVDQLERCDSKGHGARCTSRVNRLSTEHEHRTVSRLETTAERESEGDERQQEDEESDKENRGVEETTDVDGNFSIGSYTVVRKTVTKDVGVGTVYGVQNRQVLRRRTMDGFPLAYREPFSIAVGVQRQERDVRDAFNPACRVPSPQPSQAARPGPQRSRFAKPNGRGRGGGRGRGRGTRGLVRNGGRTNAGAGGRTPSPMSMISQSMASMDIRPYSPTESSIGGWDQSRFLRTNRIFRARGSRKRGGIVAGGGVSRNRRRDAFDSRSPTPTRDTTVADITTPTTTAKGPLVVTTSSFLNKLQCMPSSDEFVRSPRAAGPMRMQKTVVILTGVNKNLEAVLSREITNLGLTVGKKVDSKTRCVVSGNEARTLSVLRAIVFGVPVVDTHWVTDSHANNKVLAMKKYESQHWSDVIMARQRLIDSNSGTCRLLRPIGRILLCEGCTPPTDQLRVLIKKSGGLMTDDVTTADVIICPSDVRAPLPPAETQPLVAVLCEKYILDCICENEVLMFNNYMRGDESAFFSSDDEDDQ